MWCFGNDLIIVRPNFIEDVFQHFCFLCFSFRSKTVCPYHERSLNSSKTHPLLSAYVEGRFYWTTFHLLKRLFSMSYFTSQANNKGSYFRHVHSQWAVFSIPSVISSSILEVTVCIMYDLSLLFLFQITLVIVLLFSKIWLRKVRADSCV